MFRQLKLADMIYRRHTVGVDLLTDTETFP